MKKSYFIYTLCASTMLAFSAWAAAETDLSDLRLSDGMEGVSGSGLRGGTGSGSGGGAASNNEVEATDCELYGINCPELVTDPVVPDSDDGRYPQIVINDPQLRQKACYNASCKVTSEKTGTIYADLDDGGYVAVGCADGYAKKTDSNGCITCKQVALDPTLPADLPEACLFDLCPTGLGAQSCAQRSDGKYTITTCKTGYTAQYNTTAVEGSSTLQSKCITGCLMNAAKPNCDLYPNGYYVKSDGTIIACPSSGKYNNLACIKCNYNAEIAVP